MNTRFLGIRTCILKTAALLNQRVLPFAVVGKLQRTPSAPSLANDACPARETGFATPSTSTSTDRNSERIGGSSYRSDENMNVNSGPLSTPEPDLALHNIFRELQSSVTNEMWEESAAVNCKGEPVCNVCKNKPPAVTLTVKVPLCAMYLVFYLEFMSFVMNLGSVMLYDEHSLLCSI